MGKVLEQAPFETDNSGFIGEVPANSGNIGDVLFDDTIRSFISQARSKKNNLQDGHELVVQVPSEESSVPHTVPLEELTFSRDKENRRFFANFKKAVKDEVGEHTTRDTTVALSISAALLVAGSLYWRRKS